MDSVGAVAEQWDDYLATRPDVVKIYVMGVADPDSQPADRRGLQPDVVREVVRRAHAAGLPVWAHVETAQDAALAEAAGADGLAHLPGYSLAGDEARYALSDFTIARMGARGVIGSDLFGRTAAPEAAYLDDLGVLLARDAARLWSETTPRAVFPGRALGRLTDGFEANLLALACDPTADWDCTAEIEHREKGGAPFGDGLDAPSAER